MIKIREHEVRNFPQEFLLGEYENLTELIAGSVFDPSKPNEKYKFKSVVEKWCEVFVFCGLPEEVLEDLELDEFKASITQFNGKDPDGYDVEKEIEVLGKKYKAFEDEFKISVRKWEKLQYFVNKKGSKFLGEILAICFEDESLTTAEHKADAHIKNKAAIFRKNVNAGIVIPYLGFVVQRLYKQNQIVSEAMKEAEQENETEFKIVD